MFECATVQTWSSPNRRPWAILALALWHNQICNHSNICVGVYWFILRLSRSKISKFPPVNPKQNPARSIHWMTHQHHAGLHQSNERYISRAIWNSRKEVGNERIEKKKPCKIPPNKTKKFIANSRDRLCCCGPFQCCAVVPASQKRRYIDDEH